MNWNLETIKALRDMGAANIKTTDFQIEFYAAGPTNAEVTLADKQERRDDDDDRREIMARFSNKEMDELENWSVGQ
jgi:hypothetical protein